MENWHDKLACVVAGYYLAASALAFLAIGRDKHAAVAGRRRTPERNLHCLSAAGGWPGIWLACRTFRHKTQKLSFQRWFAAATVLNFVLLACLVFVVQLVSS
ncbi:MAG: DUF1294 domain-containing protein [Burkholderiaceae bacterium]|nr:DUF1294 domain-containing protein [Burkholderiaceae bacterium]